jgi:hypothetical protein
MSKRLVSSEEYCVGSVPPVHVAERNKKTQKTGVPLLVILSEKDE